MEGDLERYLRDIRRVGEDLERAVRTATKDLDRLGREVFDDTAANAKLGGKEAEEALLRLEKDLREGGPNVRREMETFINRLNEAATRVERELERREK